MTKQIEFLPIILLLGTNNISYELRQNCFKFTLIIPLLNIHIDKHYFGYNYYIYIQGKFIKKIKVKEFIEKCQIIKENEKIIFSML